MKYIENKRGSVLAVVVTFLVMIAVLSATLIVLLEKEIIFINPNYIVSNNDINNGDIEVENKDDINSIDLSKYQGIINGSQLRNLVQDVINNKMTEITIYVSEEEFSESEAIAQNANLEIIKNASISNSTGYSKIQDANSYKVIFEKNEANTVEKIFVIKLIKNI